MNWQYIENGLPTKAGFYYVAMRYFRKVDPSEIIAGGNRIISFHKGIWERYFDPENPEDFCDIFPANQGKAEIYAWMPVKEGILSPPPYQQEKHYGDLTDNQLIRLLVCQAQGLDDYYVECDKLGPDSGNDCSPFCPFGVPDSGFLNTTCCAGMARLMLMYFAAKRLAELTGNPICEIIKTPYGEAVEDAQ